MLQGHSHIQSHRMYLSRDGNLDLDAGLEGNAGLSTQNTSEKSQPGERQITDDLLDDLAGGVEVDQTLVDLQLEAIPGLGTLTTRL